MQTTAIALQNIDDIMSILCCDNTFCCYNTVVTRHTTSNITSNTRHIVIVVFDDKFARGPSVAIFFHCKLDFCHVYYCKISNELE